MLLQQGEIDENKVKRIVESLQTKIDENKSYMQDISEKIFALRKKQIQKQIYFRFNQGEISKETQIAQLQALENAQDLTEHSQIAISNISVTESERVHNFK